MMPGQVRAPTRVWHSEKMANLRPCSWSRRPYLISLHLSCVSCVMCCYVVTFCLAEVCPRIHDGASRFFMCRILSTCRSMLGVCMDLGWTLLGGGQCFAMAWHGASMATDVSDPSPTARLTGSSCRHFVGHLQCCFLQWAPHLQSDCQQAEYSSILGQVCIYADFLLRACGPGLSGP